MKICPICGKKNSDSSKFCVECGAVLDKNPGSSAGQGNAGGYNGGGYNGGSYNNGGYNGGGYNNGGYNGGSRNASAPGNEVVYTTVMPRSVALCVVLSIVTCGIYMFYWIYKLNNEVNELAQEPMATGGGMVILLSIVTCGIYYFFWLYKMGEKTDYIRRINASSSILYLVLGLFGLGIVSLALMQDNINRVLQ